MTATIVQAIEQSNARHTRHSSLPANGKINCELNAPESKRQKSSQLKLKTITLKGNAEDVRAKECLYFYDNSQPNKVLALKINI